MSKSADPSAPDDGALLIGLLSAASSAKPLQGKDGLFPTGAKGKSAAQAAMERGFLIEHTEVIPAKGKGKAKARTVAGLTERGWDFLNAAENPKPVLEALLPAVQALSTKDDPRAGAAAMHPAISEATAVCTRAIDTGFGGLQKAIETAIGRLELVITKALPIKNEAHSIDPAPILSALVSALGRVTAPRPHTPQVEQRENRPLTAGQAVTESLERETVAFVETWAREKTVGCPFDAIVNHLRSRHAGLTVGTFHDILRKLHESNRIRLSGWSKTLDEIPEPELALFISIQVMYYANLAH